MFPIFAPAVFAGIGDNAGAADGPIDHRLRLRRKLRAETKTRFDRRRIGHLTALGRQAARFAIENAAALAEADPDVPAGSERSRTGRLAAAAGDRRHGRRRMAGSSQDGCHAAGGRPTSSTTSRR